MYIIVSYNVLFLSVCLNNVVYFLIYLFTYVRIYLSMPSLLSYTTKQLTIALACAKDISIDATVAREWYIHTNGAKLRRVKRYFHFTRRAWAKDRTLCPSNLDMKCSCQQVMKTPLLVNVRVDNRLSPIQFLRGLLQTSSPPPQPSRVIVLTLGASKT